MNIKQDLYDVVIGLEIHAELKTKSKIFCSCAAKFSNIINENCCPICIGLPGTIPTLNKCAVEYAIKMGYATNCRINKIFTLDRKNYFYPDLPKAYQISQLKTPICENGYIEYYSNNKKNKIRIKRIHIEEDAGKLLHLNNDKSVIDFNRCGVPLIEIVTEPDINNAQAAKDFLENINIILKYLEICDCKLEEGSLRCDVNISLKKKNNKILGERVELKNINSFSSIYKSIEYEIQRQYNLLNKNEKIIQETRKWDDEKLCSIAMRNKEQENDYKYFQDPDFFHFKIDDNKLIELKNSIPELHIKKYEKYTKELNISSIEALKLIKDPYKTKLFEDCIFINKKLSKDIINWINYDISQYLNQNNNDKTLLFKINAEKIIDLINLINENIINKTTAKKILPKLFTENASVKKVIYNLNCQQISNISELKNIVQETIAENEKVVKEYNNGKKNIIGFLIGICMKKTKNRANPTIIHELLKEILKK